MNNEQCLTADEMAVIGTVFKECIETEFTKYSQDQQIIIRSFLIRHVNEVKLHTLFSPMGIKNITETVFNLTEVRDFILCLTDQFNCITALSDFNERSIQYSIGYGLDSPSFEENEYILIPKRIYENMELSGELIVKILSANKWLLTLVLIYLFFDKTNLFNTDMFGETTKQDK